MSNPTPDTAGGPEFAKLVESLKARRLEKARCEADNVMQKAMELQAQGRLTAAEVAQIYAVRLRLEGGR